jgi:pyrimidine oxygenase
MDKPVEFGVFLPVGKGGFVTSTAAPPNPGSYAHNRQVTVLAEELGLGFAISLASWRGFGGKTGHYDRTLESVSTMAGLAEATHRIQLFATMHTMAFHPAVAAKMVATIDEISDGRFGINLVAGSNPVDHGQMGIWRDIPHDELYRVATEWITIARRLWTEPSVSFDGEYYHLVDCQSDPKPIQKPWPPVLCAATSDTGMRFTTLHATASLVNGFDLEDLTRNGRRAKELAAELQATTLTVGLFMVVPGETDAHAHARVRRYNEGADVEALRRRAWQYSQSAKEWSHDESVRRQVAHWFGEQGTTPQAITRDAVVGSVDSLVDQIADTVRGGDFDWVALYLPDYIEDLEVFGREVLPRLVKRGIALQHSPHPRLSRFPSPEPATPVNHGAR